ncbi:hypothetical protein D9M69_515930 [compost metagenome]
MSTTDKELFREYLMSKEPDNDIDTVGTLYLTGHEYHDVDGLLRDIANSIIIGDPQPVEELAEAAEVFRGAAANMDRLKEGFIAYKAAREAAV